MASEPGIGPSPCNALVGVPGSPGGGGAASAAQMGQALATLTIFQRQVLVLSYFEQLTQPEIAARLGVPLAIVQVNAASGLSRLAVAIGGEAGLGRPKSGSHRA